MAEVLCKCGHRRGDHGGMGPFRGRSAFSACDLCKCQQWRPRQCEKCGGTGTYDAWRGPTYDPPTLPVPCPYCKRLRVYHSSDFRLGEQVEVVAAVHSKVEFSRATGLTLGYIRNYASETGNAYQIKAAMQRPGTVYWRPLNQHGEPVYQEKDWRN